MLAQFRQGNGKTIELRSEGMGAFESPVGDDNLADALFVKMPRGEFDGFARADEKCSLILEIVEDALGQAHRSKGR